MRKYLQEQREKQKITQRKLSEKLGISESYYNMIENGTRKNVLDMNTAQKLSEIFNVSLEFICEQEKKTAARRLPERHRLCYGLYRTLESLD